MTGQETKTPSLGEAIKAAEAWKAFGSSAAADEMAEYILDLQEKAGPPEFPSYQCPSCGGPIGMLRLRLRGFCRFCQPGDQ